MPEYCDAGRYITYALPVRARRPPRALELRSGSDDTLDAILAFLHERGPQRQFFPVIRREDFGSPLLRGLAPGDFHVVAEGDRMLGVMASWDQRAFKQNVIEGYMTPLRVLRPLLNPALHLAGWPPLPAVGRNLNMLDAAFVCVRDDDPAVFRVLLDSVLAEAHRAGFHFYCIGLHERDPLTKTMKAFASVNYRSRLYLVRWPDDPDLPPGLLQDRIPYLELGTL